MVTAFPRSPIAAPTRLRRRTVFAIKTAAPSLRWLPGVRSPKCWLRKSLLLRPLTLELLQRRLNPSQCLMPERLPSSMRPLKRARRRLRRLTPMATALLTKPIAAPVAKEDKDEFEDEDGCPELDNDQDGIADVSDFCVDAAEAVNGVDDDDGCPDAAPDGRWRPGR